MAHDEARVQDFARSYTEAWCSHDPARVAAHYVPGGITTTRTSTNDSSSTARRRCRSSTAERNIQCWFGTPIVSGDRAAVEWWASWTEEEQELTFAGVTVLRFDEQGKVVEHRDYANHVERREPPYAGWSD